MNKKHVAKNLIEIANFLRGKNNNVITFEKMTEYVETLGYAETCIRMELEKQQEEQQEEQEI